MAEPEEAVHLVMHNNTNRKFISSKTKQYVAIYFLVFFCFWKITT